MPLHRPTGGHWAVPGAVGSDQDVGLLRSPGAGLIWAHRRLVHEDRIDDAPGRFHFVLAREAQRLSGHGGSHEAVVRLPQCARIPAHIQLNLFRHELPAGGHDRCSNSDFYVRTEPETEVVRGANSELSPRETVLRRRLERDQHFGGSHGEVLTRPDVKWHVLPAPRIEIQPQRRERLDVRVGRDAGLVAVATELAADDALRGGWTDRLQDPDLLVTQGLVVRAYRWLHGEQGNDLENVILDDVPNRADFFVEVASTAYTEALRHGDLHALHVI